MGQIFLVRHGQASFGSSNYDQLSTRGESQARLLGQWFAQRGQRFDRIVTGTMTRHHQTAAACIAGVVGAPDESNWEADAGFNEYDHDEVLHRHRPEFAQAGEVRRFLASTEHANRDFEKIFQDAMARWMDGRHDSDYREPWPLFRQRCVAALHRAVAAAGASQTTIVFTSGGTIATLCQHVLHIPDQKVFALNWTLVNSAITKFYYRSTLSERDQAVQSAAPASLLTLGYLNNYAHLELLGDRHDITYR